MGLIFPQVFCGSLCSLRCVFHSLASGHSQSFLFQDNFFLFVFIASIGCSSKNFKLLTCRIWLHSKEISGRCSCWSNKNKAALGFCEVRGRKGPLRTHLSGQPQWTQIIHNCSSDPSVVESVHSFYDPCIHSIYVNYVHRSPVSKEYKFHLLCAHKYIFKEKETRWITNYQLCNNCLLEFWT